MGSSASSTTEFHLVNRLTSVSLFFLKETMLHEISVFALCVSESVEIVYRIHVKITIVAPMVDVFRIITQI